MTPKLHARTRYSLPCAGLLFSWTAPKYGAGVACSDPLRIAGGRAVDELPVFPVVDWEVDALPRYDSIYVRLGFIAGQGAASSDPGRTYVLSVAQASALRDDLDRALGALPPRKP